ncbi:large subunit ribosomal protein LP1 [Acrasis kona]|uniref:Large subunit ribosomal protein LP1 n=1 Tax=Acrasis kona TaxID=1008807 RepID=A0AAW2Z178_9EUKA
MSDLTPQQKKAAASAFAVLLLKDSKKDITAANIKLLTDAAGITVGKSSEVYAKVLSNQETVDSLIKRVTAVGAVSAGSAPAPSSSAPAAAAKVEVKEESEESEEEMGFGGLF